MDRTFENDALESWDIQDYFKHTIFLIFFIGQQKTKLSKMTRETFCYSSLLYYFVHCISFSLLEFATLKKTSWELADLSEAATFEINCDSWPTKSICFLLIKMIHDIVLRNLTEQSTKDPAKNVQLFYHKCLVFYNQYHNLDEKTVFRPNPPRHTARTICAESFKWWKDTI